MYSLPPVVDRFAQQQKVFSRKSRHWFDAQNIGKKRAFIMTESNDNDNFHLQNERKGTNRNRVTLLIAFGEMLVHLRITNTILTIRSS